MRNTRKKTVGICGRGGCSCPKNGWREKAFGIMNYKSEEKSASCRRMKINCGFIDLTLYRIVVLTFLHQTNGTASSPGKKEKTYFALLIDQCYRTEKLYCCSRILLDIPAGKITRKGEQKPNYTYRTQS